MDPQPIVLFFGLPTETELPKHLKSFTSFCYPTSTDAWKIIRERRAQLIVSIGEKWEVFKELTNLPVFYTVRWVHKKSLDEVKEDELYSTWLYAALDRGYEERQENPLVSIFTTSYKSAHRILRPLRTLMSQTYNNWEWVIYDDTPTEADPDNWKHLCSIANGDPRVRIYRTYRNIGLIGEVKSNAAALCRGQILVELDHDDDIHPELLHWLVDAYRKHPECGFYCTDWCEIYEKSLKSHNYGEIFAGGFGQSYMQKYHIHGTGETRWITTLKNPEINPTAVTHIVGVPNHVRAWRRDVYQKVSGYNPELSVADDYEILLKTFMATKVFHIPKMGYIQYRNEGANNFTVHRNAEIQKLTSKIYTYYSKKLMAYFESQGCPFEMKPTKDLPFWEQDALWHDQYLSVLPDLEPETFTIVLPIEGNPSRVSRILEMLKQQTHKKWQLFIIAGECPELVEHMEMLIDKCDDRVRWWNLPRKRPQYILINYVLRGLVFNEWVTYVELNSKWSNDELANRATQLKSRPLISGDKLDEVAHSATLLKNAGYRRSKLPEFVERLEKAVARP